MLPPPAPLPALASTLITPLYYSPSAPVLAASTAPVLRSTSPRMPYATYAHSVSKGTLIRAPVPKGRPCGTTLRTGIFVGTLDLNGRPPPEMICRKCEPSPAASGPVARRAAAGTVEFRAGAGRGAGRSWTTVEKSSTGGGSRWMWRWPLGGEQRSAHGDHRHPGTGSWRRRPANGAG